MSDHPHLRASLFAILSLLNVLDHHLGGLNCSCFSGIQPSSTFQADISIELLLSLAYFSFFEPMKRMHKQTFLDEEKSFV